MKPEFPRDEIERRNKAVKDEKDRAADRAAVIFMAQWMKRRGAACEKVLALTDWSEDEQAEIVRTFRYRY